VPVTKTQELLLAKRLAAWECADQLTFDEPAACDVTDERQFVEVHG
jgi:hypothetical protein